MTVAAAEATVSLVPMLNIESSRGIEDKSGYDSSMVDGKAG